MPKDGPLLLIADAQGQQTSFPLDDAWTWKLGRSESNAIVLRGDAASRRHAIIQRAEMGELYLLDLGSRNGTFVNGQRVSTPVVLKDNDEIVIGDYHIIFRNPTVASLLGEAPEEPGPSDLSSATRAVFSERLVSVLVIDIRGFTQLTQHIDQSVLCKFIRRWFADASQIVRDRGCWATKFIGDAVMAVWLHETGHELHEILSALTAVIEFAESSALLGPKYGLSEPLAFGAGLNSGVASAGNAGTASQSDFTAFGDAVNAAFRIEACTRQIGCDVAIGEGTVGLLGGISLVKPYLNDHVVQLKGYDQPANVWAGSFEDLRNLLSSHPKQSGPLHPGVSD